MSEEERGQRGRLKVFLGYASGIGKSHKMLAEGKRRRERGQDVVVGAVQPKTPPEVEELLKTMKVIPMKVVHGVASMNMRAILRRHPQICIVDGLAYDNPPGSRNAHRWEDVEELLAAGITVVTSVNVQFIDRQREIVEKITGKSVSETIPQQFLASADEIELVDEPHTTSLEPGKIAALRRLALILAADVVDASLRRYLDAHGIQQTWGTQECILVCITPNCNAREMIQSGKRNAERFHGDLIVAYVEQPGLTPQEKASLHKSLEFARAADASVQILHGNNPVEAIVEFARANRVTQIFVGHSRTRNWWTRLFGSRVNRLVRVAPEMDVRVFPS